MSPFYKRIRMNTAILWIQSRRNRLQKNKSLKTNLHVRRHTLYPLNSRPTSICSRLISRASAVEMLVALEEVHLSGHILLVTSVAKRAIYRKTAGQREMALAGTHPRSTQRSFQNGLLRSLLSHIPNI